MDLLCSYNIEILGMVFDGESPHCKHVSFVLELMKTNAFHLYFIERRNKHYVLAKAGLPLHVLLLFLIIIFYFSHTYLS